MKNVIITGVTGMVGGIVLQKCLKSNEISSVISLTRKKTGIIHEKLNEVIIDDFTNYSDFENYFRNIDLAFFCIGVYTGAVPRDEFRKITVDYTVAFADKLIECSPNANICFLSGAGADQSGKSRMMFAKDKGIAENYLIQKQFKTLSIFRPGYIYPVMKRKEPNFSYRLSRTLYPILKTLIPNKVITSEGLAQAMFTAGLSSTGKTVLENVDIKKLNKSF